MVQASALDMGVVTTNSIVVSNDQQELRQAQQAPPPRQHWAWNGREGDASALQRCRTRASGHTCQLYAVNDQVVWRDQ